jgi:putative flippase GtrA
MQTLVTRFHRMPEQLRLTLTGLIGASIGWVSYELLYAVNPVTHYRATSSWAVAWAVSVWRQHALHSRLTFIDRPPAGDSLRRAYAYAAGSGLLGLVLNLHLTVGLGLSHRFAWLVGLLLSAMLSLLFLKRLVHQEV